MTSAQYMAKARDLDRKADDAEAAGDVLWADSLRRRALLERRAAERVAFAMLRSQGCGAGR